jgi:SAM-dependent methyltransferase
MVITSAPAFPQEPPTCKSIWPMWRHQANAIAEVIQQLGQTPNACLLCGGHGLTVLFSLSGKRFWHCHGCHLVFIHDIYPEYAGEFRPPTAADYSDRMLANAKGRERLRRRVATLASYRQNGRWLEVGPGQGDQLTIAQESGWETHAVEINPVAIPRLRGFIGERVVYGDLLAARYPDANFDVVVSNEVIEHLIDPLEFFREIHRILRPGGIAVMGTGNGRSWTARLRKSDWGYFGEGLTFGHIRFFSPATAQTLGRLCGFSRVRSTTHGFAFGEHGELANRWYKFPAKLAQGLVSPCAWLANAGHRLTMYLER